MSDNIQLYRMISGRIPEAGKRRLLLLTGARQTGKTTLAKSKYPDLRYVNLDAPENREVIRQLSSSLWAKDIGPAVLDEPQNVFCKTFFQKVANHFSIKLQLHFPESCKIDFSVVAHCNRIFFPIVVYN